MCTTQTCDTLCVCICLLSTAWDVCFIFSVLRGKCLMHVHAFYPPKASALTSHFEHTQPQLAVQSVLPVGKPHLANTHWLVKSHTHTHTLTLLCIDRMEPLIVEGAEKRKPLFAPYYRGGRRIHIGVAEFAEDWGGSVSKAASALSTASLMKV